MKCPTVPAMEMDRRAVPHAAKSSADKTLIYDQVTHSSVRIILGTGCTVCTCHVSWPESRCICFPLQMRKHTKVRSYKHPVYQIQSGRSRRLWRVLGDAMLTLHGECASLQCYPAPEAPCIPRTGTVPLTAPPPHRAPWGVFQALRALGLTYLCGNTSGKSQNPVYCLLRPWGPRQWVSL